MGEARPVSTLTKLCWAFALCGAQTLVAAIGYRTWPRPLPFAARAYPSPRYDGQTLVAPFPTYVLLAEVGSFNDELSAYLWFDYLRSRPGVDGSQVFLNVSEAPHQPVYGIYIAMPNDALSAVPFLSQLEQKSYIDHFDFVFCTPARLTYARKQTTIFMAAYQQPIKQGLETLSSDQLKPSVARFLLFKSRTDPRVRLGTIPRPSSLDSEQASEMAADVVAVAKFYDLPLDVFLGVGAMENNYLDVRGDLQNTAWKRKAAKDDIILKRERHRVLVSNYSVGPWQITRETLRYAHQLYRKDHRDYSLLPERLRPPAALELDLTDTHVLTTYAGLLLRDLLDKFQGDVTRAVGAYNGGPRRPNPDYAAGVDLVATYARNILERVRPMNGMETAPVSTEPPVAPAVPPPPEHATAMEQGDKLRASPD
jgi:hypothetical protein